MKTIPVKDVPELRRRHDLRSFLDDFIEGRDKTVKVDYTDRDYKNAKSCYQCLWGGAKRHGYNIRVILRGEDVYMTKM